MEIVLSIGFWTFYIITLLISFTGIVLIVFNLPGLYLIIADFLVYAIIRNNFFSEYAKLMSYKFIGVLFILSIFTDILEFFLSGISAKKFGASNKALILSIFFSIILAILMAPLFFGFGAIIGALIGAFLGAFAYDYFKLKDMNKAIRSGIGAFLGKTAAFFIKLGFGFGFVISFIAKSF